MPGLSVRSCFTKRPAAISVFRELGGQSHHGQEKLCEDSWTLVKFKATVAKVACD